MSTKTLRKRIALVAVSALGFGLMSTAPSVGSSSAAAINYTVVVQGGADIIITNTNVTAEKLVYNFLTSPNGFAPGDDDAIYGGTTGGDVPAGITYTGASETSGVITTSGTTQTVRIPNSMLAAGNYKVGIGSDATLATADTEAATAASGDTVSFTVVPAVAAGAVTAAVSAPFYVTSTTAKDATIVASKPAGTGALLARIDTAPTKSTVMTSGYTGAGLVVTNLVGSGSEATAASIALTYDSDATADAAVTTGVYTVRLWADANGNSAYDSTEISTTVAVTISGAASALGTSVSLSRSVIAFSATAAGSLKSDVPGLPNTTLATVSCGDADGNPTTCTPTLVESAASTDLSETAGSGTAAVRVGNTNKYTKLVTAGANGATTGFTEITIQVENSAAAMALVTAKVRVVYMALAITQIAVTDAVGVGSVGALGKQDLFDAGATTVGATAIAVDPAAGASLIYTVTAPAASANQYIWTYRTPNAVGSSITNAPTTGTLRRLGSDASVSWTETVTAKTTEGYTIATYGGNGGTGTAYSGLAVTFGTAVPALTATPTSAVLAKDGATTSFAGVLADQFGRVQAGKTVIWSVAGRNPATGSVVTGADGSIPAVVVVDASKIVTAAATTTTAATVNTDTITFTYNYTTATGAAATATGTQKVTYSLTGPSVATVAIASATTTKQIDQAKVAGTPAGYVTYTATVRKTDSTSSGAGILCTFAGGAGDLFENGIATSVTDADGLCTIKAYRDLAGSASITATAVGITSAASTPVKWVNQSDAASATGKHDGRYITITGGTVVAGTPFTVVAKVTDRWGNPVAGVDVTFSTSGVGRLVSGETTAKETNILGEAQVQVTSTDTETGNLSVSATFAGSQASDIAGFVSAHTTVGTVGLAAAGDTVTSTAVTGVTAAVKSATASVVYTKNTSTSTADALLALATALGTRDQASAAVDAAAEATDAANAATDAANAAAEAADAATAAAQDAADAVAALSTQVSEMVAALKKQITSLTNLVIKIQKKVKA